jgi:hypothetical protein
VSHAKLSIDYRETVVPAAGGGAIRLPRRQIRAWAHFGTERVMRQAVVDTGCPICTLPKRIWEKLDRRGDVAWVADPPATVSAGGITHTTALLGGRYPYRLGRIRLRIVDLGDGELAPRDVLTLCTEDPAVPPQDPLPLIIGLAEVMNGRSLLLQVSESGERWLALMTEA